MSELKSHIVHDEMEDKLHVAHTQDIAPIIADNIARSNEIDKHAKYGENRARGIHTYGGCGAMDEGRDQCHEPNL